jgi:hypothetical protein
MAEANELFGLQLPAVWRSAAGDVPFPSDPSLDWFLRKYHAQLKAKGAIAMINRRKYLVPDKFESFVLEIALAEAEE